MMQRVFFIFLQLIVDKYDAKVINFGKISYKGEKITIFAYMKPTFTIVTVTWNAASVIQPTLDSIKMQSCTDFEYLLVDGQSTDDTLERVRAAAIGNTRIVSEPDRGLYDAMNKAMGLAQGEYIIWLNAGDAFAAPDSLARMAVLAQDRPDVIYGQTQLVNSERQVVGKRHLTAPEHLTADSFKRGMLVCHQAFVARREIMPQYDLQYRFSADYDWCIKVLKVSQSNAYAGPEPLINFLDEGTTSRNHKASLKERYRIMCKNYGTLPTMWRHLGFAIRHLMRKWR